MAFDVWGYYQDGTLDEWGNRVFPPVNEWGDFVPPVETQGSAAATTDTANAGSFLSVDTVGGSSASTTVAASAGTIEVVADEYWDGTEWVEAPDTWFNEGSTSIDIPFDNGDYDICVAVEDDQGGQSDYSAPISITVGAQVVLGGSDTTSDQASAGQKDLGVIGGTATTVDGVRLQDGVDFIRVGGADTVSDTANTGSIDISSRFVLIGEDVVTLDLGNSGQTVIEPETSAGVGLVHDSARAGQAIGGATRIKIYPDPDIDEKVLVGV